MRANTHTYVKNLSARSEKTRTRDREAPSTREENQSVRYPRPGIPFVRSVPGNARVDSPRPLVDAAGQVGDVPETFGLEKSGDRVGSTAVVAEDHDASVPRDLGEAFGHGVHGDMCRPLDRCRRALLAFPNVQQEDSLRVALQQGRQIRRRDRLDHIPSRIWQSE